MSETDFIRPLSIAGSGAELIKTDEEHCACCPICIGICSRDCIEIDPSAIDVPDWFEDSSAPAWDGKLYWVGGGWEARGVISNGELLTGDIGEERSLNGKIFNGAVIKPDAGGYGLQVFALPSAIRSRLSISETFGVPDFSGVLEIDDSCRWSYEIENEDGYYEVYVNIFPWAGAVGLVASFQSYDEEQMPSWSYRATKPSGEELNPEGTYTRVDGDGPDTVEAEYAGGENPVTACGGAAPECTQRIWYGVHGHADYHEPDEVEFVRRSGLSATPATIDASVCAESEHYINNFWEEGCCTQSDLSDLGLSPQNYCGFLFIVDPGRYNAVLCRRLLVWEAATHDGVRYELGAPDAAYVIRKSCGSPIVIGNNCISGCEPTTDYWWSPSPDHLKALYDHMKSKCCLPEPGAGHGLAILLLAAGFYRGARKEHPGPGDWTWPARPKVIEKNKRFCGDGVLFCDALE